jgi:16S rRNA A1518/A1519 N6-dimethyltransferase RsmA/KsgA/DIM1 with predicted DNA glycosylase/AP lyase activity
LDKHFDSKWNDFIRKCFAYKRKTLINNLKGYFSISKIQQQLNILQMELTIRSEQLSIETLFKLYQGLN